MAVLLAPVVPLVVEAGGDLTSGRAAAGPSALVAVLALALAVTALVGARERPATRTRARAAVACGAALLAVLVG